MLQLTHCLTKLDNNQDVCHHKDHFQIELGQHNVTEYYKTSNKILCNAANWLYNDKH